MAEIDLPIKMTAEEAFEAMKKQQEGAKERFERLRTNPDFRAEQMKGGAEEEARYRSSIGFPSHAEEVQDGVWLCIPDGVTEEAKRFMSDLPIDILKILMKDQNMDQERLDKAVAIWHRVHQNWQPYERRKMFSKEWRAINSKKTKPLTKGQLQQKFNLEG